MANVDIPVGSFPGTVMGHYWVEEGNVDLVLIDAFPIGEDDAVAEVPSNSDSHVQRGLTELALRCAPNCLMYGESVVVTHVDGDEEGVQRVAVSVVAGDQLEPVDVQKVLGLSRDRHLERKEMPALLAKVVFPQVDEVLVQRDIQTRATLTQAGMPEKLSA